MRMFHWESTNPRRWRRRRGRECVFAWDLRVRQRKNQERVDAFRLFLDRPRYLPPCFLGPCFKLFRIINELNRIRACRLPHCPRSPTQKLLSLQIYWPPRAIYLHRLLHWYDRNNMDEERVLSRRCSYDRINAKLRTFRFATSNNFPNWPSDIFLERVIETRDVDTLQCRKVGWLSPVADQLT